MFGLVQGKANCGCAGQASVELHDPDPRAQDGKPVLIVGTPGGSRIITTVLEVIVNVIDHGMTLQEAVDAPRIHHQWWPDTIAAEPSRSRRTRSKSLTGMGYKVVELEPWGAGNAAESIGIAPRIRHLPRHWVSLGPPCYMARTIRAHLPAPPQRPDIFHAV